MEASVPRHCVALVWLACCGCFSYVRLDPAAPEPRRGTEVVASLGAGAGREFSVGQITVHGITKVAGAVAYADADSLVIAARRLWSSDGDDYAGSEGLFTIPRGELSGLEERRVSAWKTGVAAAATVGILAAAVAGIHQLLGSSSGGGGKPPPPP